MTSEVPAGLSPEAELRYALIRMLVASSNCSPSAYIQTAERLLEYIETGDVPEKHKAPAFPGGANAYA